MTDWVSLTSGAEAAVAAPAGPVRGAVVVAGELFGVTDYVGAVLERLAGAGYLAAAPDFYWRAERRVALDYGPEGRERGFALMSTLTADEVVADVAAARALVHGQAGERAPGLGLLGFSAGGHIAVLAATRMRFDLLGWVYGPWTLDGGGPIQEPHPPLEDAEALAGYGTEVLGAVGDQDHVISQDEWTRIGRRLTEAGVVHELVIYPGRPHGFGCPDRPQTYDAEATEDLWRRILAALDRRVARSTTDANR